ncbi:XRE family transcriptional regulator [Phreatobacter stygius]|uniref:XRE family transcriptional regulator n=1 Tax=Phreatobacter stygius TaxID=1940610 RepID=A0A4D7AWX6_9HYPH|nr:XRE family transcriptional regulator [Phreatobacter stygius]QCI65669.1 XRE family transcriptional regulator [Phreatobacter stygius]
MPSSQDHLLGRQIAAARALIGLSKAELAAEAKITVEALRQIESASGAAVGPADAIAAVRAALEQAGAVFIPEDGLGAGVRLKFTRLETRQIGRWEGEGGRAADDDVP